MPRPKFGFKIPRDLRDLGATDEMKPIVHKQMLAEGFDMSERGRYSHKGERRPDAVRRILKELLKEKEHASTKLPAVDYSAFQALGSVKVTLEFQDGAKLAEWLAAIAAIGAERQAST